MISNGIHVKCFFLVLALPSDVSQYRPKHVKVFLNIEVLHLMELDTYQFV
jgi:hypothetical protein